MAANPIPESYPSFIVHLGQARNAAEEIGAEVPLLINTAALIGADYAALRSAQWEFRSARGALVPLGAARKAAVYAAYDFCLKTRDVLQNYLGRVFTEAWLVAGWVNTLEIPQAYDELFDLTFTLGEYFAANPAHECAHLGVTAAAAAAVFDELAATNRAVIDAEVLSATKRDVRDARLKAARRRLSDLCKELSMRLEDLDPRWKQFGFNLPGAATVPAVPEGVAVLALPGARLQIACERSANATSYRFYYQRPVVDPEPVLAGSSTQPLFVTEALAAGQVYQIYVSAVNEGAESNLSDPVNATPLLASAAA